MDEIKYVKDSKDVKRYAKFSTQEQESFVVMLLNAKNKLIDQRLVFLGTVNQCPVHPREIFKEAIRQNASGIILVHNHPSGDPTPSEEDTEVTKTIVSAGEFLGIQVLDHVIVGNKNHYSFVDEGLMTKILSRKKLNGDNKNEIVS